MNTGAFGEGFPYSNFHDLNMDWVIKIVKDFQDHYTQIQQSIDDGLEDLQEEYNRLDGLLNAWYNTHSQDIANQLASALVQLNAELVQKFNQFNTDVQNRVDTAIASIPSDYSTLYAEVQTLENLITDKVDKDGLRQVTTANIYNTDTNVLYMSKEKTVESYERYAFEEICDYTGTISEGDIFSLYCDEVTGNSVSPAYAIYLKNGDTSIRHEYSSHITISASDISSGVNTIAFALYPARGTAMSTGKAIFKNLFAVKGCVDNTKFTDRFDSAMFSAMTDSNILSYIPSITLYGTGSYIYHNIYVYKGTLKTGDVFSIICDSVTGASTDKPFTITLYGNGTEIRHVNEPQIAISSDDVTSNANEIRFAIYPAKGTVLPSGKATYTNVYAVKGYEVKAKFADKYGSAVENTITESNILYATESYTVRSNDRYAYVSLYNESVNLSVGDSYALLYDSVEGASTDFPQNLYLYNGNSQIRSSTFPRIEITEDDISAGANRIQIALYPAKGTAMETGSATYTNLRIVKGISESVKFKGKANVANGDENYYEEIPSYYFANNYLPNKVNTIRNIATDCMAEGDAFIFITDEHLMYNAGHSPALIRYIADKCKITTLVDGGDLADHGSEAFAEEYRKHFPYTIHHACGNHEWMNPISGDKLYYMLDMYNNNQIGNPREHYYYYDNPQQKLRYIVLNAYINNSNPSTLAAVSGYNNTQLAWLDTALTLPGDGWNVIIITHWINSYNPSSMSGTQDFLNKFDSFNSTHANNKILFVMVGHTHWDAIWHTTGGIPIIATTCDKNAPWISNGTNQEPYMSERPSGTIREQAFDVVLVDKANSRVKLVRIGCPAYDNTDINPTTQTPSYVPALEIRTVNF